MRGCVVENWEEGVDIEIIRRAVREQGLDRWTLKHDMGNHQQQSIKAAGKRKSSYTLTLKN